MPYIHHIYTYVHPSYMYIHYIFTIFTPNTPVHPPYTLFLYASSKQPIKQVPPVRPLFLEFPNEETLYANSTATAFEFLAGQWLLAAPVYDHKVTRDGIYLPLGPASPHNTVWVDWWNGTQYAGGSTLNAYDAPLSKVPI